MILQKQIAGPSRVFALATPRHVFMKLHLEIKNLKLQINNNEDDLGGV